MAEGDEEFEPTCSIERYEQREEIRGHAENLAKSCEELFDLIENEIGYRIDSEYEHERRYAQAMISARRRISEWRESEYSETRSGQGR